MSLFISKKPKQKNIQYVLDKKTQRQEYTISHWHTYGFVLTDTVILEF